MSSSRRFLSCSNDDCVAALQQYNKCYKSALAYITVRAYAAHVYAVQDVISCNKPLNLVKTLFTCVPRSRPALRLPPLPVYRRRECAGHLLQLVRDHGEGPEDAVGGAGDGDDPLGAGALGDVDPCAALWATFQLNR